MDMKSKLMELIDDYTDSLTTRDIHKAEFSEKFADHLISHGVTVQEWISVKDRLPGLHDDVLMYFKDDDNMAVGYLDDVDEDRLMWCAYSDGGYYTDCDYEPTHWMPLPQPPKGE